MEDIDKILADCDKIIKNCDNLCDEMKEMKDCVDFLINEYKTNKRYFRMNPGKVTIEDVIKTAFEFGWSSKSNFDYKHKNND